MNAQERDLVRRAIDARRRELEEIVTCPIGKGNETGYGRGCRCPQCREDSAKRRLARRQANLEHERATNRAWRARKRAAERQAAA